MTVTVAPAVEAVARRLAYAESTCALATAVSVPAARMRIHLVPVARAEVAAAAVVPLREALVEAGEATLVLAQAPGVAAAAA